MATKADTPASLRPDAVGFVVRRPDRPERFGLYRADGTLSNSFAADETLADVATHLARHGLEMHSDGSVTRKAG